MRDGQNEADPAVAKVHFLNATSAYRQASNTILLTDALEELGLTYLKLDDPHRAALALCEASELAFTVEEYPRGLRLGRMGHVHAALAGGTTAAALAALRDLLSIAESIYSAVETSQIYYGLGHVQYHSDTVGFGYEDFTTAIELFNHLPSSLVGDKTVGYATWYRFNALRRTGIVPENPMSLMPNRQFRDTDDLHFATSGPKSIAVSEPAPHGARHALDLFQAAHALDLRSNYNDRSADSRGWDYYKLGRLQFHNEDYPLAIKNLILSINIYSEAPEFYKEIPDCFDLIRRVLEQVASSALPSAYFYAILPQLRSLNRLAEQFTDTGLELSCLLQAGSLLLSLGLFEDAHRAYDKAMFLTPDVDLHQLATCYDGRGLACLNLELFDQAKRDYSILLDLASQLNSDWSSGRAKTGIALCMLRARRDNSNDIAIEGLLAQSCESFGDDDVNAAFCLKQLAGFYETTGRPVKAIEQYHLARKKYVRDPWGLLTCDFSISRLMAGGHELVGVRERQALEFALPTLFHAERIRHGYVALHDRNEWRLSFASLWQHVFELVSLLDDQKLLSELIEWRINSDQFNSLAEAGEDVVINLSELHSFLAADPSPSHESSPPRLLLTNLRSTNPPALRYPHSHATLLEFFETAAKLRYEVDAVSQSAVLIW